MKWLNRISSLFLIGFSVLIFSLSLKLGVGNLQNPGPGFMAFLASILLFFLSLVVLIIGIKRSVKDKGKRPVVGWVNLKKPIELIVALSVYTILLKIFGYLITIFLLLFALFFMYEPKKWYLHIVIAAIIANLSFFIFYKWLRVQLPTGIIRIW